MTAQPHDRFVFCVVVVEFAVNGNQAIEIKSLFSSKGDKRIIMFPLRTFESIATEHIFCADKLVLAPKFYYSLAPVCYALTKSFNFLKHGILIVIRICVLIAYLALDN